LIDLLEVVNEPLRGGLLKNWDISILILALSIVLYEYFSMKNEWI